MRLSIFDNDNRDIDEVSVKEMIVDDMVNKIVLPCISCCYCTTHCFME